MPRRTKEQLIEENQKLHEIISLFVGAQHDMITNMTSIGGFSKILLKEEQNPDRRQYHKIISEEIERFETILRDLKRLYEIKTLGREFFEETYDIPFSVFLHSNIQEVIDKYQSMVEDDFNFINRIPADFTVGINESLLRSIYDNLIGNTIKFNQGVNIPKPIRIDIGANDLGEFIECHYWDNGIGIKKEKIDHIFDLYYRGNHKISGSGIGLHYLETIVKAYGGEIKIESDTDLSSPDSHYAHFIFTLPKPELY